MNAIEQWINETFSNVGVLSSIQVTFQMAVCSTAISALLGIPLGLLLEKHRGSLLRLEYLTVSVYVFSYPYYSSYTLTYYKSESRILSRKTLIFRAFSGLFKPKEPHNF